MTEINASRDKSGDLSDTLFSDSSLNVSNEESSLSGIEEDLSSSESKSKEESVPSETSKSEETSKPTETSKPAETSKPSETRKPSQPEESSAPEESEPEYGTDAWCRAVEERTLYWINVYRVEEGKGTLTMLPRMREYAQRRAPQLNGNLSHDVNSKLEAATSIKYGIQIDVSENAQIVSWQKLEDFIGQGYYYPYGVSEAVGNKAMLSSDVESYAKGFVDLFRRSSSHWAYVGDAAYDETINKWIGIGVYRSYICIVVCDDYALDYE